MWAAGDHVIRFFLFPEIKARRPDHRRIDRDPDLLWFLRREMERRRDRARMLRIRRMQRESEERVDEEGFEEIPEIDEEPEENSDEMEEPDSKFPTCRNRRNI